MFDVGFWELALIAVISLLVIGPDKLPGVARTAGFWLGRARRFIGTVKADIDREIRAEELKRALEKQADLSELKDILDSTRKSLEEDVKPDYLVKALDERPAETPAGSEAPSVPAVEAPPQSKPDDQTK